MGKEQVLLQTETPQDRIDRLERELAEARKVRGEEWQAENDRKLTANRRAKGYALMHLREKMRDILEANFSKVLSDLNNGTIRSTLVAGKEYVATLCAASDQTATYDVPYPAYPHLAKDTVSVDFRALITGMPQYEKIRARRARSRFLGGAGLGKLPGGASGVFEFDDRGTNKVIVFRIGS